MKNITRSELLTIGLFAAFVFIATVTISFGQNFNLGPVSAMSRYFAQAVSTMVSPVTPATVNSTQKTTSVQTVKTAVVTTKVTQCNDGRDNDNDGYADSNDYSCVNGTTEDSLEKKLDPQLTAIAWPGGPRFQNRNQCYSYCSTIRNGCINPLDAEKRSRQKACNTATNCRIDYRNECAQFIPPQSPSCDTDTCTSCFLAVAAEFDAKIQACRDSEISCKANCNQMFPQTSSAAPVTVY